MEVIIGSDKTVSPNSITGMMRENEAVVLNFTFPDELGSYNKYIEFETNKGSVYDWIFDDKYELPLSITKFSSVTAQIVCRLDTIVWKSNTFSLKFSKSVNAIQASDDRIDTIGEIINTLKQEIEIVETLTASINQTISDIKVSLANGEFIGDKGNTGEDGQSAYLLWLKLGNEGSEEDFIASLKGEKGEQGDGVVDYDIINSYIDETTESKISDNLSELEKMVNTNTTNIANKVDKEEGKGLSTEDYTTTEKNKLSSIEESANNYTLPTATSDELGGVKVGSNLSISDDGVLSVLTQDTDVYNLTSSTITENTNYTVPSKYVVGKNDLWIFYEGTLLIKDVHYVEVRNRRRRKYNDTILRLGRTKR